MRTVPVAREPEDFLQMVTAAFNSGDIASVLAFYEPDACLEQQPGQVVVGLEAIRQTVLGYVALEAKLRVVPLSIVRSGDIALLQSKWQLTGTGPNGSPLETRQRSVDVIRRQADGRWLYVISLPWE